jgi:hypothetical protein
MIKLIVRGAAVLLFGCACRNQVKTEVLDVVVSRAISDVSGKPVHLPSFAHQQVDVLEVQRDSDGVQILVKGNLGTELLQWLSPVYGVPAYTSESKRLFSFNSQAVGAVLQCSLTTVSNAPATRIIVLRPSALSISRPEGKETEPMDDEESKILVIALDEVQKRGYGTNFLPLVTKGQAGWLVSLLSKSSTNDQRILVGLSKDRQVRYFDAGTNP